MSQLAENALSRTVEEFVKKFLDTDPEVEDFQNLISSSANRETDRQTDRQTKALHNLFSEVIRVPE